MNSLTSINRTMSSREIAEITGKLHKNVLVDCDNLNDNYRRMGLAEISADVYKDSYNREQKCYLLTRMQTFDLMTGYSVELRIRVNRRWEELEQESKHRLPQSFSEALMLAAQQAQELEQKELQLQAQAPKVRFAEAVETSTRSCLVAELAKIITQNGYEIGQNRLFKWMRSRGYLGKQGEYYNLPTQRAMEMGLFEVKKTSISKPDGTVLVSTTPKVTGKGQVYFVNKLLKGQEG